MTDRRTSGAGSDADITIDGDRRTSAAGVIADEIDGSVQSRTSAFGVLAEGPFPGTSRNTSSLAAQVDEAGSGQRQTSGLGVQVDEAGSGQRQTSAFGILVDVVQSNVEIDLTLTGTLTPAGTLSKVISRTFEGTLSPTGSLTRTAPLTLEGTLSPTGTLSKVVSRTLSGTLTPAGDLTKEIDVTLEGTLTPTGDLDANIPNDFARVSQVVVEAAVLVESDATARLSQLAVEATTQPPSMARLSQLVVEVAVVLPPLPVFVAPCGPLSEPVRSWVNLYDVTGTLVAVFDDWKTLSIEHTLNSYSVATFSIDNLDTRTPLFVLDGLIEVWRSIGSYKYIEYTGFHRVQQQQLTEDQHAIFTSTSRGLLDLVHRRFVYYQAVTAFTLKSAPGETVIKEVVNENVGPGAYNPPRFQVGITPGFTIEGDGGHGLNWAGQIANDNVLDIIKDMAALTSVDYDVVRTGPATFEFRTYYPQKGMDRSAYLAFAPELGNMVAPTYNLANDEEVNVVAVLGPGQDSSRRVLTTQGTDLAASPWNQLEGTVDASSEDTYEGMVTAGNTAITAAQPKETFDFDILQVDNAAYGRDYAVGDIVTARFGTISKKKKIVGATVSIVEGVETIKLVFSDLP